MRLLYDLFLRLYYIGIWLASPFSPKANKWIQGRKKTFAHLAVFASQYPNNIWVHCASVGEFEQGLPVIQKLEKEYPKYKILISFFSPSGYEFVTEKYPEFETTYLPLDTKKYAKKWMNTLSPQAAFFIKYEFWHHYFSVLHERSIPLFMVSAVFWKELFFFKSYGTFFRKALKKVTHFFLQDNESKALLSSIGIENSTVTGDARFERVIQIKNEVFEDERIEGFIKNNKGNILIAGSVWDEDYPPLKEIIKALPASYKIIIAPHEIDHFSYGSFSNYSCEKYTELSLPNSKILFLDTLGILSKAYRFANLVYVGGGFGKGIHNILEPAVYNNPVLIGPNHAQFLEAKELTKIGLVHIVENKESVKDTLQNAMDTKPDILRLNKNYFLENANVSEQIIVFIKKHAFLD